MDAVVRRELELVGEGTDLVLDLEWSIELVGELGARPVDDGSLRVRLQLQEDEVARLEVALRAMAIRLFLKRP